MYLVMMLFIIKVTVNHGCIENVSISKCRYDKLSNCEEPYLCHNCVITHQTKEITKLKNLVKQLTTQLTKLKTVGQKLANFW